MKVIIKTRKLELTNSLKAFTEKKFYSLKKFINILKKEEEKNTLAKALVELERETRHHKKGEIFIARCRVQLPGRSLIAKAKSDDLLKAIVATKNEMKTEIEKIKVKKTNSRRRQQRKMKQKLTM